MLSFTIPLKRLLAITLVAVIMVACGTPPVITESQEPSYLPDAGIAVMPMPETEAEAQRRIDPLQAAQEYLAAAASAPAPDRQDLQLRAVAALLTAGRIGQAEQLLGQIDHTGLAEALLVRSRLLRAHLALAHQQPRRALTLLAPYSDLQGLAPNYRAELLLVRARAELAQGQPLAAVADLIVREGYLVRDQELLVNQRLIWQILGELSEFELQLERQRSGDPRLAGWLDLALLNLELGTDSYRFRQAAAAWLQANPGHSAQRLFDDWFPSQPELPLEVTQTALLLPLTSKFGRAAQAVHDGFMAMHNIDGNPGKPAVMVYDIGNEPTLAAVYYRLAINEGADFVVGPLGKQAAAAIGAAGAADAPTLMLGTLPGDAAVPANVFQFDLSPEQEAEQVAERAYRDGHRVALALYPESDWGRRVLTAFNRHWEYLGGVLVESQAYLGGGTDFSLPIKQLFNLNNSEGRRNALAARLGTRLGFQPRRRSDVDFLFLAARPRAARLIKPQINFFQGHDVPVYATSHVYTGSPDAVNDADLNGIRFGDMPWVVSSDERMGLLRNAIASAGAGARGPLDRLFALGMDAYSVMTTLPLLRGQQQAKIPGVTAELSLDPEGRVRRRLMWAQFERGLPVAEPPLSKEHGLVISEVYNDAQGTSADTAAPHQGAAGGAAGAEISP